MRLFVAIFPPMEIREALDEAANNLSVEGKVRWIPARNIHLTLKFLGEVEENRVEAVRSVLVEISRRHAPFEIEPSGFGAFPSERRARVVWSGISEGAERLCEIAGELESAFKALGFETDGRPYSPHITLGRARGRPARLGSAEEPQDVRPFLAQRLQLVRSVLSQDGADYSTVAEYPLTGLPKKEVLSP